ncbi:MAG: hypothetical protein ACR2NN_23790 [Bryobacteraceae bacterium]
MEVRRLPEERLGNKAQVRMDSGDCANCPTRYLGTRTGIDPNNDDELPDFLHNI